MFFLMRLTRNNGKANPNPRASIAARQSHSETRALKRAHKFAGSFMQGVGGADGVCVCHG